MQSDSQNKILNSIDKFSMGFTFLVIALLLVISMIFFVERSAFYDSANYLFQLLRTGKIETPLERLSSTLPQILVKVGFKLHFSLEVLMMIFSMSYVLIYLVVCSIIIFGLKQPKVALATVLGFIFCIKLSFYQTVTETHTAILYAGLWYALLSFEFQLKQVWLNSLLKSASLIVVLSLSFYAHPVSLFLLLLSTFFYFIQYKDWKNDRLWTMVVFIFLLYGTKVVLTNTASYEGSYFSKLALEPFLTLWRLYSFKYFVGNIFSKYLALLVMGIALGGYYIWQKNILKLAWLVLGVGGFFALTLIIYREGESEIMMEKNFIPFSFLLALAFMEDLGQYFQNVSNRKKWAFFAPLLILTTLSIYSIYQGGIFYKKRTQSVKELIAAARIKKHSKWIIETHNLPPRIKDQPTWVLGLETLFISSLSGNTVTFYTVDKVSDLKFDLSSPKLFLQVPFWVQTDHSFLNENYFKLEEKEYKVWE